MQRRIAELDRLVLQYTDQAKAWVRQGEKQLALQPLRLRKRNISQRGRCYGKLDNVHAAMSALDEAACNAQVTCTNTGHRHAFCLCSKH